MVWLNIKNNELDVGHDTKSLFVSAGVSSISMTCRLGDRRVQLPTARSGWTSLRRRHGVWSLVDQ